MLYSNHQNTDARLNSLIIADDIITTYNICAIILAANEMGKTQEIKNLTIALIYLRETRKTSDKYPTKHNNMLT